MEISVIVLGLVTESSGTGSVLFLVTVINTMIKCVWKESISYYSILPTGFLPHMHAQLAFLYGPDRPAGIELHSHGNHQSRQFLTDIATGQSYLVSLSLETPSDDFELSSWQLMLTRTETYKVIHHPTYFLPQKFREIITNTYVSRERNLLNVPFFPPTLKREAYGNLLH